jgi:protoporphyrinogen oxidase
VPLVVEKNQAAGGLMRSIRRGGFTLDIGRKELYARIPEVDWFWREILRDDYHEYPRRVGSLYRGRILELSSKYRGPRRVLPLSWLISGGLDLMRCWLGSRLSEPANYQEYWYRRAGRRFARIFAQGYWEKSEARPGPTCRHPTPRSTAATRVPIPSMRSGRD